MRHCFRLLPLFAILVLPLRAQQVVYNSIPTPLPASLHNFRYNDPPTAEFAEAGNLIQLAGTNRQLLSGTVAMSSFAAIGDYPGFVPSNGSGWFLPLTLTLYLDNPDNSVGTAFATETDVAFVPWLPAIDPTCPQVPGFARFRDADGNCDDSIAFTHTFDMSALDVTLPDDFYFGLSFDAQLSGYDPTGVAGPYNGLGFAANQPVTVGQDLGDLVVTDPGTTRVGTSDPSQVAFGAQFTVLDSPAGVVTPEPDSLLLLATGLVGLAGRARRKRR